MQIIEASSSWIQIHQACVLDYQRLFVTDHQHCSEIHLLLQIPSVSCALLIPNLLINYNTIIASENSRFHIEKMTTKTKFSTNRKTISLTLSKLDDNQRTIFVLQEISSEIIRRNHRRRWKLLRFRIPRLKYLFTKYVAQRNL